MLRQICNALSSLHALGIVHRDIKPDHLLQNADGKVYLLDLDAARLYKNHVDRDTCTLGTTGFAAPEQFGIVQTDHRADIFALGVTLNILLTGYHPSKQLCTGWFRPYCAEMHTNRPQGPLSDGKRRLAFRGVAIFGLPHGIYPVR